jgi:hypothetical protein
MRMIACTETIAVLIVFPDSAMNVAWRRLGSIF